MEWRAVGFSGSTSLPIACEVNPLALGEYNYLTNDRELVLYKESDGELLLSEPKIYREQVALVSNMESVMEITDVTILIPNITAGMLYQKANDLIKS